MNFKLKIIILTVAVLFIFLISLVNAVSIQDSSLEFNSGKNTFVFQGNSGFYVKSLISLNPEIEVISYKTDNNETIGYVNLFDGIGENFIIMPGTEYELILIKDVKLRLPYNE